MKRLNINNIKISKANIHNLKNISISIPKNTLTVITGPSGSGKSSLAFNTLYVEGQRRYIESLSSYARQFFHKHPPPEVECIEGLSPTIAIDQKTSSRNPRSTVGTVTEIFDYMRILFARLGTLHCPDSGKIIIKHSPSSTANELMKYPKGSKIFITAPIENITSRNEILNHYEKMGFIRAYINKIIMRIDEWNYNKKITDLKIIIDRIILSKTQKSRLISSLELAFKIGKGKTHVYIDDKERAFSEKNISPRTKKEYPELEPQLFSFNSPLGACPKCNGIGEIKTLEPKLLIINNRLPLLEGAIELITKTSFIYYMIKEVMKKNNISLKEPFKKIPEDFKKILFFGSKEKYNYKFKYMRSNFKFTKKFPGLVNWYNKKYEETNSEKTKKTLSKYIRKNICHECRGMKLNKVALSTKINNKNIIELGALPINILYRFFQQKILSPEKEKIAEKLLNEIKKRLDFLTNVGLDYLTLNQSAISLSGGESQRIRLATQIGSSLSGVLYILDEPSIGLHQKDNIKLINTLKKLRDIGNTVIVVEHDKEMILNSDYIIDMGPGSGNQGGKIVGKGYKNNFLKSQNTLTTKYINGKKKIETPIRRKLSEKIILTGITKNNLSSLDVEIPTGGLVCITGPSGSGKSTLVHDVLTPACKVKLNPQNSIIYKRSNFKTIKGINKFSSIIEINQSPIGRTPLSNPATYTNLFTHIRELFSQTPEAKIKGYKPGRFSFNLKEGRCENCEGNGIIKIKMHFLPDVEVICSECNGSRYNEETLQVYFKNKNISDILSMTISEACTFFKNQPKILRILETMNSIGLGYMTLGQPATTLSGGEAQRLKLSQELAKRPKGKCLYVLDEPTTGLHFDDIKTIIKSLNALVDNKHTVLVIEHNMDVIKSADYIIDMGPEGGKNGGKIVAQGTPENLTKIKNSYTGKYLKKYL